MEPTRALRTGDVETAVGVTDPRLRRRAERVARRHVHAALAACSTSFSSEIVRTRRAGDGAVEVSPLLAHIVGAALEAALLTAGAYDPTAREQVAARLLAGSGGAYAPPRRPAGWQQVHLDRCLLQTPRGTTLSLQPVALALAAEDAAAEITARYGCGALVVVGTSAAVAGETREWDLPGGLLAPGEVRSWGGPVPLTDPATGHPVLPTWREVVVTARRGATAVALVRAASAWGPTAPERLGHLGVSARLVSLDGARTLVA